MNCRANLTKILVVGFTFLSYYSCNKSFDHPANYYISNNGNDSFMGTTPGFAWKSISRLNSQKLRAGDSVFFRAGDTWRETLYISSSGKKDAWIFYGRYGSGPNPEILGSDSVKIWVKTDYQNVWKAEGSFKNFGSHKYPGNIFFSKDDSITWAEYKK